jgi:hypothetical protein
MEREKIDKGTGRRIMREFRLQELSAVDRPAQQHAKMILMKRDDSNPEGDDMDKKVEVKEDAPVTIDDLTKTISELTVKLEKSESDRVKAESDLATEKAKLDPDDEEYAGKLDPDSRKAFIALTSKERKAKIGEAKKAAEKADEIMTIEGVGEIRKSVVGESQFAYMKTQQERLAKQEKELAAERDLRKRAELTKVVTDEYDNLPGELEKKVDVMKAVDDLPEEARKTLTTMLTAGNKAIGAAFTSFGHNGEARKRSAEDFMKKVEEVRILDKCSNQDAMQKVRKLHPDLFLAYQGQQN